MKTEKNILIAFILNLGFSLFELVGGLLTGSVAIASDALHDFGDAASIGVSYYLERKSKKGADEKYTYGYGRYSLLGGAITTFILLFGSVAVTVGAIHRFFIPVEIHYNGMIVTAAVGVCVNLAAALVTREGRSVNQRAVNLHMLEDVLGWVAVLASAVVMRFTDWYFLDPIMSIAVAVFIFVNAVRNLVEIVGIFLEKTPKGFNREGLKSRLLEMEEITDVHHIHVRNFDTETVVATLHAVTPSEDTQGVKAKIKAALFEMGITHVTVEIEGENEECADRQCCAPEASVRAAKCGHHHHHHHHSHHQDGHHNHSENTRDEHCHEEHCHHRHHHGEHAHSDHPHDHE